MKCRSSSKRFVIACTLIVVVGLVRSRFIHSNNDQSHKYMQRRSHASYVYNNSYGAVVESSANQVPGAVTEKIILFPQKDSCSREQCFERNGVLIRYPNAKATILICHGFMTDKFDVAFLRLLFEQGKYNIMTFDFRAHGENVDAQKCTLGRDEAYDVIAAARFLKENPAIKNTPLLVYGFSMGAVAAIEAQAKDPLFQAMILDCPFDSSERVLRHNLGNIKMSLMGYEFTMPGSALLERYVLHPYVQSMVKVILKTVAHLKFKDIPLQVPQFQPAQSVQNISVPCFFIHCKNDDTVPLDAIKQVYNGAQGYKKLWLTNGRRHYDSCFYNPEAYVTRVRGFISEVVTGSLDASAQGIVEDEADLFALDENALVKAKMQHD